MRWPWIRETSLEEPRRAADLKVLELRTAKEILAERSHIRPSVIMEMIQSIGNTML